MSFKLKASIKKYARLLSRKIPLLGAKSETEAQHYSLPDWQRYVANSPLWRQALTGAVKGKWVLIPTRAGGLSAATILEGMLGVAMTLRGAQVRFLLCDGVLPCRHELEDRQGKTD